MFNLTGLLAMAAMAAQGEPKLLDKATLLWSMEPGFGSPMMHGDYDWWSTREIFHFHEGSRIPFAYDVKSKKEAPVLVAYSSSPSPDHKRTVAYEWAGETNPRLLHFKLTDLSGQTQLAAWDYRTPRDVFPSLSGGSQYEWPVASWSRDGRFIFQAVEWNAAEGDNFDWHIQIVRRDAASPTESVTYPDVDVGRTVDSLDFEGQRAIAYAIDFQKNSLSLVEWSLVSPASSLRKTALPVPAGQAIRFALLSPDHRKWLLETGPIEGNTIYYFTSISLWTCGLHGEGLKELGVQHLGDRKEDCLYRFGDVAWHPDSKHVSFVLDKKLYWVKV